MRTHRPNAFTLAEVLVSIGIIAILMALSLPVLMRTREVAGATKSLANLRSIASTVDAYTRSHNSEYPFAHEGDALYGTPPDEVKNPSSYQIELHTSSVWWLDALWPTLMHNVAPWRQHFQTWVSPGKEVEYPIFLGFSTLPSSAQVSYYYCNSFLGDSTIWEPGYVPTEREIHPVRTSMVSSPSLKALMYDSDRSYIRRDALATDRRPVLSADSSAKMRLDSEAAAPIKNPHYIFSPRIYHDTLHGVKGIDY